MLRRIHGGRDFATLSPLEIDEYLAVADAGMSDSTSRATISDIDRAASAIVLREHKTARKTGKPRRIPIGRKLGELVAQAIGQREAARFSFPRPGRRGRSRT
jgi:hypothetical protein